MKTRNVKIVSDVEIMCEVEHPFHGWMPYTAVANSGEEEMEKIWQKASKMKKGVAIDIIRNRAVSLIIEKNNDKIDMLDMKYGAEDRSLFDVKRKEAEEILSGSGDGNILLFEAGLDGRDVKELANKVIQKSDERRKEIIRRTFISKRIREESQDLKTVEEIDEFVSKYNKILTDV